MDYDTYGSTAVELAIALANKMARGVWAMMTVAIGARRSKKFYCQGCGEALSWSSHAFCARRPSDRLR